MSEPSETTRRSFLQAAAAIASSLAFGLWPKMPPAKTGIPKPRQPMTLTWTGASGSMSWTDPRNWDQGVCPREGDTILFPPTQRGA